MVTWILAEEPSFEVAIAIEMIEARLGSEEDVTWLAPGPQVEPAQD